MVIKTRSSLQTEALGQSLGRRLKGGDFLCLYGDLGSGKTTFTRGLARGAGFEGQIASPTFVLVRTYKAKKVTLYHLDLYRVASGETGDIGIEELLADPKAATVIEWPQAGGDYYPKDRLEISFALGADDDSRRLKISAQGSRSRELLKYISAPGRGGGRHPAASHKSTVRGDGDGSDRPGARASAQRPMGPIGGRTPNQRNK
jgi:tRNA threonylcarbamoyladenosine biosynthesis protein TsaE